MEASGERLTSSAGHLPGSVLIPGSSVSVGMGSSRKFHNTWQYWANPKKAGFGYAGEPVFPPPCLAEVPEHHPSSFLVPTAEGLTAANTARAPGQSYRATTPAPLSPAPSCPQAQLPTLLSGQQRHVHVLGGMQERGGSGLRMAGRQLLCRGFEGALDGATDPRAVLGAEEDVNGALSASHGDLESLGKGERSETRRCKDA